MYKNKAKFFKVWKSIREMQKKKWARFTGITKKWRK
jgi:hypothetical protein